MKALAGAAIGTLALGVLLLASGVVGASYGSLMRSPVTGGTATFDPLGHGGAVVVSCDAGQRAVVRQARPSGNDVSRVDCVSAADSTFAVDRLGRGYDGFEPVAPYDSGGASIVRAGYTTAVRHVQPARRVVYRQAERPRSWQKTLLIIGGTAGAGAGVGAIVGGKKGALLGAAIGGGAATVYDQITRRRSSDR